MFKSFYPLPGLCFFALCFLVLSACVSRSSPAAQPLARTSAVQEAAFFPGAEAHSLDLYRMMLGAPVDWTFEEVNRRPQPEDVLWAQGMYECAEYKLLSPDGTILLWVRPMCGFAEASSLTCGPDGTSVVQREANRFIWRWWDKEQSVYRYAEASGEVSSGGMVNHQNLKCTNPPVLVFETEKSLTFIEIELQYAGSEAGREQALEEADRVVTSLRAR